MLGWEIFISRQLPGEALENPSKQSSVGCWHGGLGALKWIDALVKEGRATDLGGDGYPVRYLAAAKDVIPVLRAHQRLGDSRAAIHEATTLQCDPDEKLIIEAWDQS